MPRPKKPGAARHLHIDPYVWVKKENNSVTVDDDPRMNKFLAWYDAMPAGQRTKLCLELMVAAANGELGVASTVSLVDDDSARSKKALDDLLKNMVLDED
jgi:hypothetical protein